MDTIRQPRMSRAYQVLSITAIATFLVSLDTSIVVVARRAIEEDLGHPTLLTWVFSGYNIAYAAGLLTAGRFADVNGRKRSFLRGLALFSIGSILCGLAPTSLLLVLARLVQAIGGAMLTPASLALVLPEFPVEKRTVAIGIWGAVGGLAAALGPCIGGVLVDWLDWRSLFFINVPFCAVTLYLGNKILHESKDPSATKHVDLIGTALGLPGVALVTLSVVQSGDWGYIDQRTITAMAVGCILLGSFVKRCSTVDDPLLDLTLFKMPFVVAANLSGFFFSIGFLGMWMLQIQWLQVVWQYSPTKSGLATAAGPLTAAILAAPMGRLAGKWGHAKVLFLGSILLTTGTIGFSLFLGPTPHFLTVYLPLMIICGSGVGCSMSVLSSSATAFLPPGKFAMGSALNTTGRQVGSALGAALALSLTAPTIGKLMAGYSSNPPRLPSSSDLMPYLNAWRVMGVIFLFAGIVMVALYQKPTEQQMIEAGVVEFVD